MTTTDATTTHLQIRQKIAKLDRIRRDHLKRAEEMQTKIDALQSDLVSSLKDYMAEMGVQTRIMQPRKRPKETKCSICVGMNLPGDGHTAARHHVLVVRGDIKEPDQP